MVEEVASCNAFHEDESKDAKSCRDGEGAMSKKDEYNSLYEVANGSGTSKVCGKRLRRLRRYGGSAKKDSPYSQRNKDEKGSGYPPSCQESVCLQYSP